jgi:hypothetical protein
MTEEPQPSMGLSSGIRMNVPLNDTLGGNIPNGNTQFPAMDNVAGPSGHAQTASMRHSALHVDITSQHRLC